MIDALYRNSRIRVRLKEEIKRIDGSFLEHAAELPRRAAERLAKLGVAEVPRRDYSQLGIRYIEDSRVRALETRIEDFIYVELLRSEDRSTFRKLALNRGTKVVEKAFKDALAEFSGSKRPTVPTLNEEENVLYRMVLDVVRFRLRDLVKAAEAFKDLGL